MASHLESQSPETGRGRRGSLGNIGQSTQNLAEMVSVFSGGGDIRNNLRPEIRSMSKQLKEKGSQRSMSSDLQFRPGHKLSQKLLPV